MGPFAHSFAIFSIPYSRPLRQFVEGLPEGGARALSPADCGCFAAGTAAPFTAGCTGHAGTNAATPPAWTAGPPRSGCTGHR